MKATDLIATLLAAKLSDQAPGITQEAWLITLIGMGVVFSTLTLIYVMFYFMPKILNIRLALPSRIVKEKVAEVEPRASQISGELNAAISATIFLYLNELHDEETRIVTINRTNKHYSPWSSKIYQVNNLNRKFK